MQILMFLEFRLLNTLIKENQSHMVQISEIWSCIIGKCKGNFEKTNCICQDTD